MGLFSGTAWERPARCERCDRLIEACECPPETAERVPPEKQTARLAVERRKRGKSVTVIRGLSADDNDLPALLTELKSTCGAGGAIKDGTLEIQGDQLSSVRNVLGRMGYRVRG